MADRAHGTSGGGFASDEWSRGLGGGVMAAGHGPRRGLLRRVVILQSASSSIVTASQPHAPSSFRACTASDPPGVRVGDPKGGITTMRYSQRATVSPTSRPDPSSAPRGKFALIFG